MRQVLTRRLVLFSIVLLAGAALALAQNEVKPPETFSARATASAGNLTTTAEMTIQVDQYTTERQRAAIQEGLRSNGYQGFLPALRNAPEVGYVELNGRKVAVRWARQQSTEKGRTISIVTDKPLFFVGGGAIDAKSRAGYEVAVILMDVDAKGSGTGTVAAAARVKPGGVTGVQIDDYAEKPVTLTVTKKAP